MNREGAGGRRNFICKDYICSKSLTVPLLNSLSINEMNLLEVLGGLGKYDIHTR